MRNRRLAKVYSSRGCYGKCSFCSIFCYFGHGKTLLYDETIIDLSEKKCLRDCEVVDAKGEYVSAGFIDIHTHGCYGNDNGASERGI